MYGALKQSTRTGDFTWACLDAQLLRDAICAVTARGDALMLGITSDGGAGVLTVLTGKERVKVYVDGAVDATSTFLALVSGA